MTVRTLSVTNTAGTSSSPAVSMTGDKVLLDTTSLTSTDRTVWADVPTAGATSHQLIEGSTVSGANNVVLDRATLVVHASTIVATKASGTLLIPSTTATNGHGFLVIGSTIAPAAGVTDVRLGAGYAQGTTTATNAPEAVVRDSVLNAGIKAQVWQDFNGYTWVDGRFAEYANSGAGAGVTDLRPQLSPAASTGYTVAAWLGTPTWYAAVADPATPADVSAPATPVKADVVVAADGSGDATTVAAGLALLADNADCTTQGYRTVLVQPGTYSGAVSSGNRYGVRLVGATTNAADTVLTAPGGATATLTISGKGWTVSDLTLTSVAAAAGAQATALQIKAGDQQVVDNVRMLGDKQTLLVSTANATTFSRVYVRNSYLEGGADLVLGRAVTVIDRSTLHVLNRPGASLTDSSVDAASAYGFLITGSRIVTDGNPGSVFLGRPYSTQGKAQVVVRETELDAAVATAGPWKDWDATTPWTAGRFFEYKNTGPGAEITSPATRPQLSDADAATFTAKAYLAGTDGWNPTA